MLAKAGKANYKAAKTQKERPSQAVTLVYTAEDLAEESDGNPGSSSENESTQEKEKLELKAESTPNKAELKRAADRIWD